MKRSAVCLSLLLLAVPALADTAVTEIRLGTPPPPAAPIDPAKVKAVERFLVARQQASVSRKKTAEVRRLMAVSPAPGEVALFGDRGVAITAFDFQNEAVEPRGSGRFEVPVYLIFANSKGEVVESRSERLTFSRRGDSYVCSALQATDVIVWWPDAVSDAANSLGVAEEYMRAQSFLAEASRGRTRTLAYSLADVQKADNGTVVVQCLRFESDRGKRGFAVNDAPIVLTRSGGMIRIESN